MQVSADIFGLVEPPSCDVLDGQLWRKFRIVEPLVVADGRWHVDVAQRRRQRHANVDVDGDSRSVDRPIVELAVGRVVAALHAAAAGVLPVDFVRDRYRLLVIFSKNHWLPKFCIVCLM